MSPTLTSSRKSDSLHATGLVALMEVPSSTGLRKQAVHNTPERASQERGCETAVNTERGWNSAYKGKEGHTSVV